jgi:CRISPR type III-B/RAMP module-associated protein Cmr5
MMQQQRWALLAHKCVLEQKEKNRKNLESFRTHCMSGPTILQRAGTAQALAFFESRDSEQDAGKTYLEALAIIHEGSLKTNSGKEQGKALLHHALESPLMEYMVLSQDLLEISAWLRRFAQIEFTQEGSPEKGNDLDATIS